MICFSPVFRTGIDYWFFFSPSPSSSFDKVSSLAGFDMFSWSANVFKICTASIPVFPAIQGHRPEPSEQENTNRHWVLWLQHLFTTPRDPNEVSELSEREIFPVLLVFFSLLFYLWRHKHIGGRLTTTAPGAPLPAVGSTTTFTLAGKGRKILGWLSWKQGPACSGSCTQQWSSWEMYEFAFSKA